jgi:hypothetical protein
MKTPNLILGMLLLLGCQLEDNVNVKLPPQNPSLVVEAVLRPGKPMELTFTESGKMSDSLSQKFVENAIAFFVVGNDTIPLKNRCYVRPDDDVAINYTSEVLLPRREEGTLKLYIQSGANILTSEARFVKPVVIKECRVAGLNVDAVVDNIYDGSDRLFRMEVFLYLGKERKATYRDVYNFSNDNSAEIKLHLNLENKKRDSLKVVVSHISKEYYEYIYSCARALDAFYSLLTVPTPIKSNIKGGVGIFTVVVEDSKGVSSVYP